MSLFHVNILTIFPEMFPGLLNYSLAGQALAKNIWSYDVINIRDFGKSKHKKVDDEAYGGGNGLIMRADVVSKAIEHIYRKSNTNILYITSPRGELLSQKTVRQIIGHKDITILCGRFEGIDNRISEEYNAQEISIGDYILSGGELAAQVILDSCIRLLPGVLQNQDTLMSESFEEEGEFSGLLECAEYTRPAVWKGRAVPEVLLSGHHENIKKWRKEQSFETTLKRRPDLIKNQNS